jgi:hypothetical protein
MGPGSRKRRCMPDRGILLRPPGPSRSGPRSFEVRGRIGSSLRRRSVRGEERLVSSQDNGIDRTSRERHSREARHALLSGRHVGLRADQGRRRADVRRDGLLGGLPAAPGSCSFRLRRVGDRVLGSWLASPNSRRHAPVRPGAPKGHLRGRNRTLPRAPHLPPGRRRPARFSRRAAGGTTDRETNRPVGQLPAIVWPVIPPLLRQRWASRRWSGRRSRWRRVLCRAQPRSGRISLTCTLPSDY